MNKKEHWESVYTRHASDTVSWYQTQPTRSLELLVDTGIGPDSTIIDVGGGDSTLVDALVQRQLGHVTVLDLSRTAIERAKVRLGPLAQEVTWIEADVTRAELPPKAYDVWHDRAVFHFLTEPQDRARYITTATASIRPGGTLIVATFASDGPTHCSGLAVARYCPEDLAAEFGDAFALLRGFGDVHKTPSGAEQQFTYAVFRR